MSAFTRKGILLVVVAAILGTVPIPPASGKDSIQDPLAPEKGRRAGSAGTEKAPLPPEKRVRFVEAWRVPLGSPLSGPLLALDDRVVASVEDGEVQAFSLSEGSPLWKADLEQKLAGGPVEVEGLIVQATASGSLVALDREQGQRRWSLDLQKEIPTQITATSDGVLIPLAAGGVVSVDPGGRERWRVDLRGEPSVPVSACRGMVLAGTEAGTVESFDRISGRRLWVARTNSPVRSPLLCYRDRIYFGTADDRLRTLRYSGRKRWSYKVGAVTTARPFALGRRVYFLCYDNYIYALKATSGNLLLRVRMSHRLANDAYVAPEKIYLSPYTSARLLALSLPDLQLLGDFTLDLEGEWFTTPPVLASDRLVIGYGRYEGRILALKEEKASDAPPSPGP